MRLVSIMPVIWQILRSQPDGVETICRSLCSVFDNSVAAGSGIEVLVLKDHAPPDSPDLIVISKAYELGAVLISLNGDFADIVSYPPENYQGIISLQIG